MWSMVWFLFLGSALAWGAGAEWEGVYQGPWAERVVPGRRGGAPLTVRFQLPSSFEADSDASLDMFTRRVDPDDMVHVRVSGHDPVILTATLADLGQTAEEAGMNRHLHDRSLEQLRSNPERYQVLDPAFKVRDAQGRPVEAVIVQERTTRKERDHVRGVMEGTFANLPPEHKREVFEALAAAEASEDKHSKELELQAFAYGKKVLIHATIKGPELDTKQKLVEKIFASVVLSRP